MLPQEIIRKKRDRGRLEGTEIRARVPGATENVVGRGTGRVRRIDGGDHLLAGLNVQFFSDPFLKRCQ